MQIDERIDILEKRIAALESKEQAQQFDLSKGQDMLADIVIRVLNKRTLESGKQPLLM